MCRSRTLGGLCVRAPYLLIGSPTGAERTRDLSVRFGGPIRRLSHLEAPAQCLIRCPISRVAPNTGSSASRIAPVHQTPAG
jgi:hypothetical protein